MELKFDSMTFDIPYWYVFRAQTGISSAAILTLPFILFHRGNRVRAAHGVHVPTCLHTEVLSRSASTHAHTNLSTSLPIHLPSQQSKSKILSPTVCPLWLKYAPLHSQSPFSPKVTPQKQESFDPGGSISFASPLSTPP